MPRRTRIWPTAAEAAATVIATSTRIIGAPWFRSELPRRATGLRKVAERDPADRRTVDLVPQLRIDAGSEFSFVIVLWHRAFEFGALPRRRMEIHLGDPFRQLPHK